MKKVLIVGGGIGGLTAAIALRQRGIEAVVYEKSPELRDVGAGISLWPNAVKALRRLGLDAGVDSISQVNGDAALRRSNGTCLSRTSERELTRRFGGGVMVFHRRELLDLLACCLGAEHIQLGRACAGLAQNEDGVTVTFANGEAVQGDALVGADGLHSVVRTCLGHREKPRYSGYTAWRAVVPFDTSTMVAGETWGRGRRFGMVPVQGNRVYWYATNNETQGGTDAPGGARSRLLALFRGWHSPIEDLIRAARDSEILRNDICDRNPVASWGTGRVTLLGDAAHPMTPNLGQGACQAIEDALELAARLALEPAVTPALRRYESLRMARTASIVLTSRRIGDLCQVESPILCGLRDLAMRLTPDFVTIRSLTPVIGYEGHLVD